MSSQPPIAIQPPLDPKGVCEPKKYALTLDRLKLRTDPATLPSVEEAVNPEESLFTPIAQERALSSLDFGLDIQGKGYHIFVMGPPGSGKTSTALRLLQERAVGANPPHDTIFVFNFKDPDRPRPMLVPNSMGEQLQKDLQRSISGLSRSIFRTLFDENFTKRTSMVNSRVEKKVSGIFEKMAEIAEKYQLGLEREQEQFLVIPLMNGEPIEPEVFEDLTVEQQEELQSRISAFQREAAPWMKAQREQERSGQESLARLERWAIQGQVDSVFEELKETFAKGGKDLLDFLEEMHSYVMKEYRQLLEEDGELEEEFSRKEETRVPLPYRVNLLTAHREEGAPVVVEKEPGPAHLFGYLEYRESVEGGAMGLATDHTHVRAGALHRANGGYLVLQAADLIRAPEVWESLKRALRHKEIRIHDPANEPEKTRIYGAVRPLETPLNLKIVMVGSAESYYILMHEDEDFERVFKVKAEFEPWVPRDALHERAYCRFLQRLCNEEDLLPLSVEAMGLMIEESAREVGAQEKLSTSLTFGLDLLSEADYWARKSGLERIGASEIQKALSFRIYRHESLEKSILESIDKGVMMIDTDGEVMGQINGLLVYLAMDHSFGIPAKITARTYAGKQGVMNIDREANLSGVIHDKGSMILVGLLGGLCAQKHPLAFNASITFEQNYGEIEGDSASCAEFFALLSSLAQIPIYQGIAVTGSINQQGVVQPIGGVNEKVEGMFKICKRRGLTGRQGVIIPQPNVDHLMLRDEVIEAVEKGEFHIWSIKHVFEGLEILMGMEAGVQDSDGNWSKGCLFERVQQRLDHFYQISRSMT